MNTTTQQLARSIRRQWQDGQPPDTRAALSVHPELEDDPSVVVRMAYEEFCLRRQAGEDLDPGDFCDGFPAVRPVLAEMLMFDGMFGNHPSLVKVPDPAQAPVQEVVKDEAPWPKPGSDWGDCRLLRELGRGSFSRVYLASERPTGDRPVVLKFSQHACAEARTLGRLHHTHVVPILWARRDEAAGWHVVCMPFLGSATLMDVLVRFYHCGDSSLPTRARAILDAIRQTARPGDPQPDVVLPWPDLERLSFAEGVAWLAVGLAEALAFLHERNRAHCDLKPSNVLLGPQGRPLLLDFNLARVEGETAPRVGGTIRYMAPEQLEGFKAGQPLSAAQAARADLFSLGVLLYELLTGTHPFGMAPGFTPSELLRRQKEGFEPIRQHNPAVPERMARLVERCLSTDPDARSASAATLARQLRPTPPPRLLMPTLALVLVGTAMTFLSAPADTPPPPDPVREARQHREAGQAGLHQYRTLAKAGKTAAARRSLQRADESFKQALALRPADDWEDHFHRGQVRLLLGDYRLAGECFLAAEQAQRKAPGPRDRAHYARTLVYLSYSYTMSRQHPLALKYGEDALDAGTRTAALLNNLAFAALQGNDLSRANRYLAEALRRDPHLPTAYRNRAVLGVRRAQNEDAPVPRHALDDIERAVVLGKQSRRPELFELHLDAARIYGAAADDTRNQHALLRDRTGVAADLERSRLRQQLDERNVRVKQHLIDAGLLGANLMAQLRDRRIQQAVGKDFRPEQYTIHARPATPTPALAACLVPPLRDSLR
jgi:serine/threonine protein kinase